MTCMLLQREPPAFELRFACNFKGCLDDRPMSIMGAIEHQAFHFSEVYKTQVHFNFKCDLCNVYHVNKSHHRLCLDDPTGIGHLPYLRSIYTVPMSDPEFHNCVDFGRFVNNHMIAVTSTGGRLLPGGAASYLPLGANRGGDAQSADNCDENGNSERFGRSGGGYYDRNQNDSGDFRGRGRGGYRGRGDRGGFGRGRGRGGRGGFRGGDDDDGGYNGRDNNFRGRGRGRGGGGPGRWNDRDDGYNSGHSYGDNGNDVKPPKDRSYSRSRSGSPVAKRTCNGDDRRSSNVKRSYSRSRSSSPCEKPAIAGKGQMKNSPKRSYSRSRSSSPIANTVKHETRSPKVEKPKRNRSYSRSGSSSPPRSAPAAKSPPANRRSSRSYSRSGSRSPPRQPDLNNNPRRAAQEEQTNHVLKSVYDDKEDYMNDGYGSNRYSQRGSTRNNFNRSTWDANERNSNDFRGRNTFDKENDQAASGGQQRMSRGVKRGAERRDRSYSKSGSCSD